MSKVQLVIETKIVGADSRMGLGPVVLDLPDEQISVGELIAHTVTAQIRDLVTVRRVDLEEAQRALDRQYLIASEVERQASAHGEVKLPTAPHKRMPHISAVTEVRKARAAFEAGTFTIFVNGQQVESLDQEIEIGPDTKVTFLRLTPLVGG